jgi:serine/threonine protein kinase
MCKISDFGIAADLAHSPSSMCHSYVGTHMYMSPERITARPYSYESDIWSFGLTLVHCATGRKPYEAKGGVLALIQEITSNAQHLLPEEEFSAEFKSFLSVW